MSKQALLDEGLPLRHVLDVRHETFKCAEYLALARRHGAATVFTDSDDYPSFADITGSFVYARLMRTDPALPEGCTPQALAQIEQVSRQLSELIESISAATRAQNESAAQMTANIKDILSVTELTTEGTQRNASSTVELAQTGQARSLIRETRSCGALVRRDLS